jgi:CBS domain-containing protein
MDVNETLTAQSRLVSSPTRLRDIMSTRLVTIGPREAASEAWTRMRRRRIRHLVVMEEASQVFPRTFMLFINRQEIV